MQILNYRTTRQLLTRPFAADALTLSVSETLALNGWQIGQPQDPERALVDFTAWLNPTVDEQAHAHGVFDLGAGKAIMALAIHYFTQAYPNASQLDIASAAKLVEFGVTGMSGGFGTDEYPLERYCEQLIMATLGGAMDNDGTGFIPETALQAAPSDEQTRLLFHLIEGVYFKTRERDDRPDAIAAARAVRERNRTSDTALTTEDVIREVIADLDSTRTAFKSKVIMSAREKLETLL